MIEGHFCRRVARSV